MGSRDQAIPHTQVLTGQARRPPGDGPSPHDL